MAENVSENLRRSDTGGCLTAGGAVGEWLAWRVVARTTSAHPSSRRAVIAGFLVLGTAAGLFVAVYAFTPLLGLTSLGAVVAADVPILGERLV